jgi:WD40 repeat protein
MKALSIILNLLFFYLATKGQEVRYEKILEGHDWTVLSVDTDPEGKFIASGSYDNDVILWDYITGQQIKKFKGHKSGVWAVDISPNARYMASGSRYNNFKVVGASLNCLNIWDLQTFENTRSLSITPDRYKYVGFIPELDDSVANGIVKVMFNQNGSKVGAITCSGDLFIWNIENNFKSEEYNYRDTEHKLFNISPDWNYVACCEKKRTMADTGFYLIKLGSNKIIAKFNNPKRSVVDIYFPANLKYLASISGDRVKRNELDIWDVCTQKLLFTLQGHSNVIRGVAFSANEKYVASAGEDNIINLWNIETGNLVVSFTENNNKELTSVIFSSDQKYLISGSQDKTIKFWQIDSYMKNQR